MRSPFRSLVSALAAVPSVLPSFGTVACAALALTAVAVPVSAAAPQVTVAPVAPIAAGHVPAPGGTGAGTRRPPVQADLKEAGVQVTAWSPWPDMLYQGYEPIEFELLNQSSEERTVDITLARGWGDDRWSVFESVTLPPGGRERRELFGPVTRSYAGGYQATLACRGTRGFLSGLGATQPANFAVWPLLYVHDPARTPQAGATEVWSAALAANTPAGVPHVEDLQVQRMASLGYVSTGPAPALPPTGWSVALTAIGADELPARFEPYTSLKGVIVDAQGTSPRPEALDALLAWTRLGGCLVFQGPDAEAKARAVTGAAAWMEDRFLLAESGADRFYACGQGALVIAAGRDLQRMQTIADEPDFHSMLDLIGRGVARGISSPNSPQHEGVIGKVPGLGGLDLPYRSLTLLLVLFAILIGPVNLIVVKKLNRPALLLVTVPLIALVFSIGLFVYGAIAQGLGTRARSISLTWLDQRAHAASTLEVRSLFAGMPAGNGWRPGPGAACVALTIPGRATTGKLELDFREGLTYGGDFLPVRREVRNAFLVDRAARGRLSITRNGERVTVENGLGADLTGLVLRDADGGWHVLGARLAQGGRAELERAVDENLAAESARELLGELQGVSSTPGPFPGTYLARLGSAAFVDACGVDYVEEESEHVVFGILDPEGSGR